MKIFQILHGMCHWETPFKSLDEIVNRFPTDCLFVEAPDYVTEQWGYDEMEIGDDRFIAPSLPEGLDTEGHEVEERVLDDDRGVFVSASDLSNTLSNAKDAKQEENNTKLSEFITSHPLVWEDGKSYGITVEDQTEIRNALEAYRSQTEIGIENPILQWHAINEAASDWAYEDLQRLYVAIYTESNKWYTVNQNYKTAIYACETTADLNAIEIIYESDAEKAEREEREAREAEEAKHKAELGIDDEEMDPVVEPEAVE